MSTKTDGRLALNCPDTGARIELDKPCQDCETTGVVYSTRWAEWNKRYDAAMADLRENGEATYGYEPSYHQILDRAAKSAGPEPQEPEELMCAECEGTGYQTTRAGSAILALITRHRR